MNKPLNKIIYHINKVPPYSIFLILGLLSLTWFKDGKLINGVDTIIPNNLIPFLKEYYYVWTNKAAPGMVDVSKLAFLFPIGSILSIITMANLKFSPLIFESTLVYLLFIGAGLSAYTLFKTLFPGSSSISRICAGILYMFNFYVLFIFTPLPLLLLFSYCFFPYVFSKFIELIHNPTFKQSVFFSLVWVFFLNSSYTTPPYIILHISIFISYYIFHTLYIDSKNILHKFKMIVFSIMLWSLASSYFLIPFLQSLKHELTAYVDTGGYISTDVFLMNSVSIHNAFRLMGYFGLDDSFQGIRFYSWFQLYKTAPFILLSYLLPVIAFSGLIFNKRNKIYYFFAILSLLFIFLLKGPYYPLGFINAILYDKLHLYTIFRTGYQRFTGFLSLAFVIMAAYNIDVFYGSKKYKTAAKNIIIVIFLLLVSGVFVFPIWTGEIFQSDKGSVSMHIAIPNYYKEAESYLNRNQEDANILPLPFSLVGISNFVWNKGNDGYSGSYPLANLTSNRFYLTGANNSLQAVSAKMLIEGNGDAINLLRLLNVRYILFQNDSNWDYVRNHGWWISGDQVKIYNNLLGLKWIDKVDKIGELWFFRIDNLHYLQHFYIPQKIIISTDTSLEHVVASAIKNSSIESLVVISPTTNATVNSQLAKYTIPEKFTPVISQKINQTKYLLSLKSISFPTPIVFSETFDPGWKIFSYEKSQNGLVYFFNRMFAKPLKIEHFLSNGYANGWLIDPVKLCKSEINNCVQYKDGSYDLSVTVELEAQKTTEISYLISAVTITIITIFLTAYRKRIK